MTDTMPAQIGRGGRIPRAVHEMAYEVYHEVEGSQPSLLIERDCRGGFGTGELIAYLYARNFPKSEWRQRVDEAFAGFKEGPR
jgi:hypothetical protein